MPVAPPPTASKYYATSALAATAASRAAVAARPQGIRAAWLSIARFQVAQAVLAPRAVDKMLAEQDIDIPPLAALNPTAFATTLETFEQMVAEFTEEWELERLAESLVQDAGRAAQGVSVASRPRVSHVRHLNLPSCSRCAVLAGRVYRFSEGFQRHPGCDCVMIPVTLASPDLTYDPVELAREGQVTGLSKADLRAVTDGADFNKVANVRQRRAGLTESGRVLNRAGKPTPEAVYRLANDREEAVALLKQAGYLR